MAVDIDVQNQKFGARMMDYLQSQAIVQESGLWCQARERAVSFYERAGFQVVGEPFDVPKIGEHRGMVWAG
jgi:ribosomal protein S18 acetylase RimI-like enzyme